MRIIRYREKSSVANARKNRLEIIAAGLSRRELIKYGLISSSGYLVFKNGLSQYASGVAWGRDGTSGTTGLTSPPTRAFIEPMPIPPVRRPVAAVAGPAPTINPNTAGGEGRTRPHQAFTKYPSKFPFAPAIKFETHQRPGQMMMSPDLPLQTIWGHDGIWPAPTYYAAYGQQILVRNFNDLPDPSQNGGFGIPEVSTHLHNLHSPSESDGFPCDFFGRGKFYDHHYTNVLAGFASTHPPDGDLNEALGTLWYHDHRVDFTAQNVYKGLAGFYLLYNQSDTGDEQTGFRIPGVGGSSFYDPVQFDVPMMLADRVFDPNTGQLFFDLFNLDGILGDKFLVNGKVQPFFEVEPRRYRFRLVNSGPSRWYEVFLTDQGSNTQVPFWLIANDGNLLPAPLKVTSVAAAVAERRDIIIDFRQWAGKTLYFENRLEQTDGRGPTGNTLPAGAGNFLLQFRVKAKVTTTDNSLDPSQMRFYALPDKTAPARVTRTFRFERGNGQWQINGRLMDADCSTVRLRVKQNSVENWVLQNNSGGWMHPIHIHVEEFQILSRNGVAPSPFEVSRKDVAPLHHNENVRLFFRFRDWEGRYPLHCHNVVHEDHAMMLRWDIDQTGDTNATP
jgi:FtsP/CotA-like multicopper oxidase with cupredoxin domain